MNKNDELQRQISKLVKKRRESLRTTHQLANEIFRLRQNLKVVCSHERYTIAEKTCTEQGTKPIIYQEKICDDCGEVLGTRSMKMTMSEWTS